MALVLLAGCFSSGSWEDDPGNWERAFQQAKPDNVEVVHSHYWRSAHWTYEFAYSFQIKPSKGLEEKLLSDKGLKQVKPDDADFTRIHDFWGDKPKWFLPKPLDKYEIWIWKENSQRFRLFIDRETRELFLTDWQV